MTTFEFKKLDAYVVAKQVAVLVQRAEIRDLELRDRATRAAKSCFLNIAEGLPSFQPGMRRKFFACARGSLGELAAALDLATVLGLVDAQPELDASIARLAPIVCGLLRHGQRDIALSMRFSSTASASIGSDRAVSSTPSARQRSIAPANLKGHRKPRRPRPRPEKPTST